MSTDDKFKKVISHAKEYGFVFQSSEIYDGLSAVYDYGQNGTDLKNNIKDYWLKAMVQLNDNIVNIDSAILMHPKIWEASGHVDAFNDPLIDNKDSKKRYRADVLIEDYAEKLNIKAQKDAQLTYRFLDTGTDLFGKEVNLNTYIRIAGILDPSFGSDPEPIELTRLVAPKTSRAFVFANAENYEIYLQRFNIFSQIQAFTTFGDDFLDDDNVIYLYLIPDVSINLLTGQDYFDIPVENFILTTSQKLSILNLIEDSGQMIATTVVKILDPQVQNYVGNLVLSIFEGYDPEVIKDKARTSISEYFINLKRRDRIPKSDIIAIVEAIEGVDSVSFYFVGQTNEEYHTTIDNLANASAAQLNRQIGLDDFGDVIINSGELVLLRGGWTDRYGTYYEVGIVPGKPSALNISIASVNLRTLNNQLNSEQRARIIAQNQ